MAGHGDLIEDESLERTCEKWTIAGQNGQNTGHAYPYPPTLWNYPLFDPPTSTGQDKLLLSRTQNASDCWSADNLICPQIPFDLLSEVINLVHRSEPVFRIKNLRVCPMRMLTFERFDPFLNDPGKMTRSRFSFVRVPERVCKWVNTGWTWSTLSPKDLNWYLNEL